MAVRASDAIIVWFLNVMPKIIGCYFKPMINLSDYYKMKLRFNVFITLFD